MICSSRYASANSSAFLHMIMSSPIHVTIYIQGSCVVPFNPNSDKREKISWDHRAPACGCNGNSLLIGKKNPDGIYIP